LKEITKSEKI